jgi:hypothetical protein
MCSVLAQAHAALPLLITQMAADDPAFKPRLDQLYGVRGRWRWQRAAGGQQYLLKGFTGWGGRGPAPLAGSLLLR